MKHWGALFVWIRSNSKTYISVYIMPANDTLRRPQAKTTFRASVSFLILMVLSMREVAGLCSGVMICTNKDKVKRKKTQFLDSKIISQHKVKEKNRNLKLRALPLGAESCLPNKKQTNPTGYFYCVYKDNFSSISPPHYCKAASFFSSEVQIRGERQNLTSFLKDNILQKQSS